MSALQLGEQLVKLCSEGKFMDVINEHYADDVVSVESVANSGFPRELTGLGKIKEKNQWWAENHEVHSSKVEGPFPHGSDRFAVIFEIDVTAKVGPTAGQRGSMREVGVYTVQNGKITREEFFYGAS